MNLAHLLLQSALRHPGRPALAVGKQAVLSFGELASRVSRLSSGLARKLNLAKGDRVALAMKNCPEYYELLFACWHAGLTPVPMNAKLHAKEFAYILENAGAKACFVSPGIDADGIALGELKNFYLEPEAPSDVRPDDTAWLFYTSGTTGPPKGALKPHRILIGNVPGRDPAISR